jgi:RNA ligase
MKYDFPHIEHIDDVLLAIQDSPEFIVAEKDGYKVVNYVVATHETFPDVIREKAVYGCDVHDALAAIRRECRGLVFDMDGKIINRRYHKFFNVNERDETAVHAIDWSRPHVILEKLDGSMVSPCYVNGHLRWMTKMGITDTSMEAEAFVASRPDYARFAVDMLESGLTPIFEWCSNKNRIVLDYPEDRLVLTALRSIVGGLYISHNAMMEIADDYYIPFVKAYNYDSANIVDIVRKQEDTEGVVVRFDDGHMVKIKSEWYVRIHKVKSLLGQERDVVKLILNNELDDLLPILPGEDVDRIDKFQVQLSEAIRQAAWIVYQTVNQNRDIDRKTFALNYAPTFDPLLRGLIFKFWDGVCDYYLTYKAVVDMILKHCGSNASYEKVKEAFLKEANYV